jgi:hypothetical protein
MLMSTVDIYPRKVFHNFCQTIFVKYLMLFIQEVKHWLVWNDYIMKSSDYLTDFKFDFEIQNFGKYA